MKDEGRGRRSRHGDGGLGSLADLSTAGADGHGGSRFAAARWARMPERLACPDFDISNLHRPVARPREHAPLPSKHNLAPKMG